MRLLPRQRLTSFDVSLKLPYVAEIKGTWEPDEAERRAAWEMYVELVTRISVQRLQADEGSLREALTSLYRLFDITREILRRYGPAVARPGREDDLSFGYISVAILNGVLRPVLAKWHPALLDHESRRSEGTSVIEHERRWELNTELRRVLSDQVQPALVDYANLLATVANVPRLTGK